jgi:hypothetical protein
MKPQELIPGISLLMYKCEIVKMVIPFNFNCGYFDFPDTPFISLDFDELEPIEITPEILSKAYYEKDGERVSFDFYEDANIDGTYIDYYDEGLKIDIIIYLSKGIADQAVIFGRSINIEGFHHLQQIMYALFRIELRLEL